MRTDTVEVCARAVGRTRLVAQRSGATGLESIYG
jgi:hypothetical protein